VILDGELVTTDLQALNIGLEELVEHAYYDAWDTPRFTTDPVGNPISPNHPWNMETRPRPSGRNWREKYTWCTAPRWDRQVVEAECTVRERRDALHHVLEAGLQLFVVKRRTRRLRA
jgi:hydrogenase large subunit